MKQNEFFVLLFLSFGEREIIPVIPLYLLLRVRQVKYKNKVKNVNNIQII